MIICSMDVGRRTVGEGLSTGAAGSRGLLYQWGAINVVLDTRAGRVAAGLMEEKERPTAMQQSRRGCGGGR